MLRKLNDLIGFTIAATDGEIGSIKDFYFDDKTWDIRYAIVDTGPWIMGKQVLLVPSAIESLNWSSKTLAVDLSMDQVKESPPITEDQPVSRQNEIDLHNYYGLQGYWYVAPDLGAPIGSASAYTAPPASVALRNSEIMQEVMPEVEGEEELGDPHLRSLQEVLNYNIQATNDDIGHIEDFFVAENDWKIRYIMVDTRNWLPGRNVLVSTAWIDRFDWAKRNLYVELTKEQIKDSPEYNPQSELTRAYESDLHDYYRFPGYW